MRVFLRIWLAVAVLFLSTLTNRAATLSNLTYRVDSTSTCAVVVTEMATGASATFQPNFRIMFSPTNTGYQIYDPGVKVFEYEKASFYPTIWNNDPDFFNAPGTNYLVIASTNVLETNTFHWVFAGTNGIAVDARISVPAGSGEPVLSFELTTAAAGYYTIGYVGAPERTTNQVDWMWQPLFWTNKRFPSQSFLTAESQCTIPAVFNGYSGQTVGLAVGLASVYSPYNDPAKRLLDTTSGFPGNYGVVLRNEAGNLQPMVFTPVYGQASLAASSKVSLAIRLVARRGEWYDSYKYLATSLYGFSDYRTNVCSLNTTLDNMQDFIQGPFGHWLPRYKAWDYLNDKPGWGRQQSSADAISLAIVKDDLSLFTNISRPTLEYMLSRQGAYFLLGNTNAPDVSPGSTMGGWIGDTYGYGGADMASVYQLSGKRCTVVYSKLQPTLSTTALTGVANLDQMRERMGDLLSNFRITGNPSYLAEARKTATNYIALRLNQQPTDAADIQGNAIMQIGPAWYLMNEMYDETGDPIFRDAFVRALREFTAFNFLIPPSGPTNITVTNYLTGTSDSIPAWRVDARGLMREASSSEHSHAGIFMAPFASYMLRAAQYTNDSFLRAIGRSAVIGRYANYPGYAYRRRLTDSYEQYAWPLQDYPAIKPYITMHFNHPLPMTTYLLEYLVADASSRSGEQIKFPSCFSWTGAYFIHKVYGAAPGLFYGDTNVFLWMPKALVTNSSVQINYVSGYGNGNFYLALMNQSSNAVNTQISINSSRVNLAGSHGVKLITDNVLQPATIIVNGTMTLGVSGMGITALVISNATVATELQSLCYESNSVALPTSCYQTQSGTPVGNMQSQLLSFGTKLTSAFVSIDYDTNNLTEATLRYETNGVWNSLVKPEYPFEFTVPLADNRTSFRFYIEGRTPSGVLVSNSPVQLGYQLTVQSPQGPGSPATSTLYNYNQSVTASVPAYITSNSVRYVCAGWTMAGNAPAVGATNTVTLALTNDATLTWMWQTIPLPAVDNAAGTSAITSSTAWLNGTLTSTGRAPTSVFFFWGPTNAGANRAGWASSVALGVQSPGAFSNLVSGLAANSNYYYRASATNSDGEFWAPTSASFATASLGSGEMPAGYRMQLSFTNYNRAEVLTNFPALIVLGTNLAAKGFSYSQFLSPNGQDLRFKDASQTQSINYEIARWDTNGLSQVWVQVPRLSNSASIWASWGDAQDAAPLPCLTNGATWSNGFAAVWHLNEVPGTDNVIHDSTASRADGLAHNLLAADQDPGLAGGSLTFDGATKFIALNSELVVPSRSAFTVSAWIRPTGATVYPGVTAPSTSPGYDNSLRLYSDAKPRLTIGGGSKLFNTAVPKDGNTWSFLAVTRGGGSPGVFGLYENGTNDTGTATSATNAFPIAFLGRGMETNDTTRNWNGGLAEIRVSTVDRSSNWVWAEYLCMAPNNSFVSYGLTQVIVPITLSITNQGSSLVLSWPSAAEYTYDLERATNLNSGFLALVSDIPATPPLNRVTNAPSPLNEAFYRLKAKNN